VRCSGKATGILLAERAHGSEKCAQNARIVRRSRAGAQSSRRPRLLLSRRAVWPSGRRRRHGLRETGWRVSISHADEPESAPRNFPPRTVRSAALSVSNNSSDIMSVSSF